MAVDRDKTLAWLNEVSEQAFQEARLQDTSLANRLGKIPAFAYYFQNVHTLKTITAEQYANQYPGYLAEADRTRVEYEALESAVSNADRLTKVEAGLTQLGEFLKTELAAIRESLAEPKKPGKKRVVKEVDEAPEEPEKPADEAEAADKEA